MNLTMDRIIWAILFTFGCGPALSLARNEPDLHLENGAVMPAYSSLDYLAGGYTSGVLLANRGISLARIRLDLRPNTRHDGARDKQSDDHKC